MMSRCRARARSMRWPIRSSPSWCSASGSIFSLRARWIKADPMPPRLAVRDITFFERPVTFARPFRFGAVVINATPQAFVRAEIEVEGKGRATGASAEFLVPKWFDKRPQLSPDETVAELRRSLLIARELYLARSGFDTAFGLHA